MGEKRCGQGMVRTVHLIRVLQEGQSPGDVVRWPAASRQGTREMRA